MAVGFGALSVTRSGMQVSERALETISHNVANIDTKGYSRQRVDLQNNPYVTHSRGFELGLGANVQGTVQIRDAFLDQIYRAELSAYDYWDTVKNNLEDVERIIAEPMWNGLQEVTNDFWEAWRELSKDPMSLSTRSLVVQRGEDFANHLNYLGDEFYSMQKDLDVRINNTLDEINDITKQIAVLNGEILKAETGGQKANDYRDKRNLLVDKLSSYIDVNVAEDSTGQIEATVSGYVLISKMKSYDLESVNTKESGYFSDIKIEYADETIDVNGGKLEGLIDSRGRVLGSLTSQDNGFPNSRADVTFALDVSEYEDDGYVEKMKNTISSYIYEMDKRGIDYNLRLVAYGSKEEDGEKDLLGVFEHGDDKLKFIEDIRGLNLEDSFDVAGFNNVSEAIAAPTGYREDVNKYAIVLTKDNMEETLDNVNFKDINEQNSDNPINFMFAGNVEDLDSTTKKLEDDTKIKLFDIQTDDFTELFKSVSDYINSDIGEKISEYEIGSDVLPFVLSNLNSFANVLLREINYIHSGGTTLRGDGEMAQDFFVPIDSNLPLKLGNIMLNPNLEDVNNVSSAKGDNVGNNKIALDIANLSRTELFTVRGRDVDPGEFYQSFMMDLGVLSSNAKRLAENQKFIVENADNNRETVKGVSMDEELSNVMKYKFAYNAASRAFNLVDEMIDIIINRTGHVGR